MASALSGARPLPAQEIPDAFDLVQLERRYDAAVTACEAAVLARRAEQSEYERAVQAVNAADRLGDEDARGTALSRFVERSQVIDARQRRVVERCDEAAEVRRAYLTGLDRRRRALEDELATTEEPARRADVQALLGDIDTRYQELEAERGGLEVQLVMRPLIDISSTDTPAAVEQKAAYLQRLVAMADSLVVELDDEIERIESRIQRQRSRENFQSPLDRFDQLRTPVSSGGGEEDVPPATPNDSTAVGPQSLEARLRAIRDARLQIEHYGNQMEARVREFREWLERIT